MKRSGHRRAVSLIASSVAVAATMAACGTAAAGSAAKPAVASPPGWVLPGHDYDNSRATRDSTIRRSDVASLSIAWTAPVGGSLTTVPLIVGDTVYVQDGSGRVTAVDRATGAVRWQSQSTGLDIGPFGVAVANGRVFALRGSTGVLALDAETGNVLWTTDLTSTASEGIDIQPTVFAGRVYVATVPVSVRGIYKGGDRGKLFALDAKTGSVRWSFDTVRSKDLWGNPGVNSGGGAWYPPAIDVAHHLVYWGIANPAPFPGTPEHPNGSSRPGPNLYTDSIVALDTRTGRLRWYHQVTPHDLFDRDLVHAMIATTSDGRRVVVAAGKGGVLVGLDPVKGTQLWATRVGDHENDQLTELTGPTEIEPGTFGGVITPPATADGTVYAAAVNAPVTLKPDAIAYFGAKMGQHPGVVVAVDAEDGKPRWSTSVPGDPLGAVTVVNDLVFTATLQGSIVALDRATGAVEWTTDPGGGINGWMSAAGDLLIVPVGNGRTPQLVAYRVG